jgi:hypothetical protein
MKMAMNEMVSLSRAALEGTGWAQGDYEDAADAAVWLEAVGLDGTSALTGLLGATPIELYAVHEHSGKADPAERAPGLVGCLAAFELAWAQASQDGIGIVRVTNAMAPRLALYGLRTMCDRGRRFDVAWSDAKGWHFAATSGRDAFPTYLGYDEHAMTDLAEIVVCCRTIEALPLPYDVVSDLHGGITSAEFEARYDESLWRGLEVDEAQIACLGQYKTRVLVEATAASRAHGAGGQDDGF